MLVKDVCRKHGISDATYYNWKSPYASEAPINSTGKRGQTIF
jgi:putative transposase